jgi:TonB family protein
MMIPRRFHKVLVAIVAMILVVGSLTRREAQPADPEQSAASQSTAIQQEATGVETEDPISRAVKQLRDPKRDVRLHALHDLCRYGAVHLLIAALSEEYEDVRCSAAYRLGHLGDGDAVEPLIWALLDPVASVRVEVVRSLGLLKVQRAIPPLMNVLSDEDPAVRNVAIATLKEFGLSLEKMETATSIPEWHRERGLAVLYIEAGRAIKEFEAYLQEIPEAGDAEYIGHLIEDLRAINLSEIHEKGEGITAPKVLFGPRPDWTEEARSRRVQGDVMLEAVLAADGKVRLVRVVRSLGFGLDEKAIIAARYIRFEPATRDGRPVHYLTKIRVNFKLL